MKKLLTLLNKNEKLLIISTSYKSWSMQTHYSSEIISISYETQNADLVVMNNIVLENKKSFSLVEVTIEHKLSFHKHVAAIVASIVASAVKKLGFQS